jgi:hypothetical protein
MKGQRVAAFGCSYPRRGLAREGDLLAAEARLVADHSASAALALQAVAHGDARWLALNRKVKLPATAGGASGGHGPAPWLRWIEMYSDLKKNRALFLSLAWNVIKKKLANQGDHQSLNCAQIP